MSSEALPESKACGFLIYRREPIRSFLLMRHPERWDLPKGHVDPGEDELTCALRELEEETGIAASDIEVDPAFRFSLQYKVNYKNRNGGGDTLKTAVYFLARLHQEVEIQCTEHGGHEWFPWNPPHAIQVQTIDPLLAAVEAHFGLT